MNYLKLTRILLALFLILYLAVLTLMRARKIPKWLRSTMTSLRNRHFLKKSTKATSKILTPKLMTLKFKSSIEPKRFQIFKSNLAIKTLSFLSNDLILRS